MTIKALFVAPYAAMEKLIEECREQETDMDIQIRIGNLQEGVELAKQAEAEGFEVIISRGGTAKMISEAVRIPVIDVHVSGYDMLRVLTLANDFPRKKAIVGFPAITGGAKAIIDLLDIPIDMFTIHDEDETEDLLHRLKQEGYELIMGDVVTFETASRLGLIGILIQSGRESLFDAFKEAKTVARWLSAGRLEIERYKAVLQVAAEDIVVVSGQGEVVYEQWQHFSPRLAGAIGLDKDAFLLDRPGKEIVHVSDPEGQPVKVIKTPIEVGGSQGLVCEFIRQPVHPSAKDMMEVHRSPAPLIIHQSESMNTCLAMVERSLSYDGFVLIGGRGSGKKMLARYIHDRKFSGEGLFASVKAPNLPELCPDSIDAEIKTLYIYDFDRLEDRLEEAHLRNIEALRSRGLVLIFAMTEEQPVGENRIYDDEIIRIHIPALAERKEDLKELVTSCLLHFTQTLGTSAIRMTEKGFRLLADYDWPGNVSELKALLQEAVMLEKGYVIGHELIEQLLDRKDGEGGVSSRLLKGTLAQIEKRIIEKVMEEEGFNQTKAAKRLQINRSTLWRKLKE